MKDLVNFIVKPSSELTEAQRAELTRYLPKEIDVDTMADCFYLVAQNFTAIKERYGKIEPWGTDSQKVKKLLQYLSDFDRKTTKLNQKQKIFLDRVLSKPWNKWKLAKALAYLETRQTAPPIWVHAYEIEGIGYWYIVTNGMHRATAAKMTGQLEIEAIVLREIVLDCSAIRQKFPASSGEYYLLEILGIKKSLRGLVLLLWKIVKSIMVELES